MTIFEWIKDYASRRTGTGAPETGAPETGKAEPLSAQQLCDRLSSDASAPDGLIDYASDYSDAACAAYPDQASAYRPGIGYIDDEEQARWLQLGAGKTHKA